MDASRVAIYGGRYFASSEGHIYNASGKRLSVGIEINESYCEAAVKRLSQKVLF